MQPIDASLTLTSEMVVDLKPEHIQSLEQTGQAVLNMWRTDGRYMPLRIYVRDEWRAQGVPPEASWSEKQAYEIDMPSRLLGPIKDGKTVVAESLLLRKVFIKRYDAF